MTDDSATASDARLGVDVGGTFTDAVLLVDGERTTEKVPTTDDQSEGVRRAVERACETAGIDPAAVDQFRHATTVAVNAMLEDEAGETALVTTEGFRDVLEIGRQDRPALYDLTVERPDPLVPRERRFELDERATPEGVEREPDAADVDALAATLAETDVDSVAVSLLHAYAHPETEERVAERLRAELDVPVSTSHEVLATFREYERTATTVADASLRPVVDDYLARLLADAASKGLPEPDVMGANGGIASVETVRENPVRTLLSGPAAGVVGASLFEDAHEGIVTLDMGGTSSDVGLVRDGEVERTTEATVGDRPVGISMVDVETVGAGGGSVAWVDSGGALRVGPESAGANPGPACYGRGGAEPTVADACLVLGYLGTEMPLGGEIELDPDRAEAVMADLADEAGLDDEIEAARGVYRVANAAMTEAIRGVTVERGHDPRGFALVAFGGAGPMHAARLAERLDVDTVVVPPANGVLSALGLLAADERHDAVRTHRRALADVDPDTVEGIYRNLIADVERSATDPARATLARQADCRYVGQSFELTVDVDGEFDPQSVRERFHDAHERARGYRLDEPVDLVNLRVTGTVPADRPELAYDPRGDPLLAKRDAFFPSGFYRTPLYDRRRVPVDVSVDGPAVFVGGESTVVVPPTWTARATDRGALVLEVGG